MIRRASLYFISFLQRSCDFFANRASPGAIRILPCQAIMFPRVAEDILCVLVHFRTVMFLHRVLMLRFDEATANLDGIQLVGADASIQYFFTPDLRVEEPFPVLFHDWNRQREIIFTYYQYGFIWSFLAGLD